MLKNLIIYRIASGWLADLDEIKETTGTHPAWQGVRADNRGMWPYYELPATPAKR